MQLSNNQREFNEKWDVKLNKLLTEGEVVDVDEHTLKFKLKSGKFTVVGIPLWDTYDTYEVWVDNKNCNYAHLHCFNKKYTTEAMQYQPSQSTMDKLYELEKEVRHLEFKGAYE